MKKENAEKFAGTFHLLLLNLQKLMQADSDLSRFDTGKFSCISVAKEMAWAGAFLFHSYIQSKYSAAEYRCIVETLFSAWQDFQGDENHDRWRNYQGAWRTVSISRDELLIEGKIWGADVTSEDLKMIAVAKRAAEFSFGIIGSLTVETTKFFMPYLRLCWDALPKIEASLESDEPFQLKANLNEYKQRYAKLVSNWRLVKFRMEAA